MENKFYHGIDDLTNGERYGLKLQLKSVNNKSVFKEYFSFEAGIQGFHIVELMLLIGGMFYLAYFDNWVSSIFLVCLVLFIHFLEFRSEKRKRIVQNKNIKSQLSKGLVFLINGRIIKKTSDDKGFQLVFEDNTVIRVFPNAAHALKKNDFVSIRYLKEFENYSRDESFYEAHKILELSLFSADFKASICISSSSSGSYYDPYSEVKSRQKWEDKLIIISQFQR